MDLGLLLTVCWVVFRDDYCFPRLPSWNSLFLDVLCIFFLFVFLSSWVFIFCGGVIVLSVCFGKPCSVGGAICLLFAVFVLVIWSSSLILAGPLCLVRVVAEMGLVFF